MFVRDETRVGGEEVKEGKNKNIKEKTISLH